MTKWKHRDSELDRTCGKPVVNQTAMAFGRIPTCATCDGDVYRLSDPVPVPKGKPDDWYLYEDVGYGPPSSYRDPY